MFYRGIPAYVVVSSACGRVAIITTPLTNTPLQALVEIERWPIDQFISHLRTLSLCFAGDLEAAIQN